MRGRWVAEAESRLIYLSVSKDLATIWCSFYLHMCLYPDKANSIGLGLKIKRKFFCLCLFTKSWEQMLLKCNGFLPEVRVAEVLGWEVKAELCPLTCSVCVLYFIWRAVLRCALREGGRDWSLYKCMNWGLAWTNHPVYLCELKFCAVLSLLDHSCGTACSQWRSS